MKRLFPLVCLLALPLGAQEYKMAVIGLVHSHVWGHLPAIAKSTDVKLVGIAETNPDLVAEAKKVVGADGAYLRRLQEDARRAEARPRLVVRAEQPAPGDREGLRAAQDQRDLREAAGRHL